MIDRSGQQLGNYRLIRFLGRGGFAEIYLGEHLHLKTQAAIKVLHAVLGDDDVEEFLYEAQTVARLKHPHIVRVFDFDIEEHIPFLVMDYLPNGSLRQHHRKGSSLPLSTIVSYVKQIADALQYAHDAQVIHRDIKPENMLLGQRNEVVLSDFGIALMAQSSRSQGTQEVAGTAAYMAPEQFQGKPRRASDQYALAVMIYEWVCGSCPFHGSFIEIASQHLFALPPSLREKVPVVPLRIEEVLLKALAKDPQERFPSVQAFASAFEQASQRAEQFNTALRSWPSSVAPMGTSTESSTIPPGTEVTEQPSSPLDEPIFPSQQVPVQSDVTADRGQLLLPVPPASAGHQTPPSYIPLPSSHLPQISSNSATSPSQTLNPSNIPASHSTSPPRLPPIRLTFRQSLSRKKTMFLIGVVFLVIFGSVVLFSSSLTKWLASATPYPAATVSSHHPVPVNYAMFGFDPQHTRFNLNEHVLNPGNVSQLVQYWMASTGAAIDSSPAVANGIVYVGSQDHKLYAFNATTGRVLWTASTGAAIISSPAVTNGSVYVGSDDHKLYAFNATTGKVLWTASTGAAIDSSPTVANGIVYVGSQDHMLYAFNATTGKTLWLTSTGAVIYFSSPAVANGVVYIGSWGNTLYAFNAATGKVLWTASTGDSINSSPAVANGVVYVGSGDHKLYALNATTGKVLWTVPTGDYIASSPAVANGVVYVGSGDHKLYALDATMGKVLWTVPTGNVIYSSPTVANGVVYVGSWDSTLYAFDASTGKALWLVSTSDAIDASPTVANGVVYVGSQDHKLYAFHLPGTVPK